MTKHSTPQEETLRALKRVKSRHLDALMAIEGVISVGIGQNEQKQACIIVSLNQQRTTPQSLPSTLEGYPVVIQHAPPFAAQ